MAQLLGLTGQLGCLSLHRSCRRPVLGCSNSTLSRTCMGKKDSYHVEVTIDEREPMDAGMRRFRRAVMDTNLINETRRRRYFENTQDIRKRKIKEKSQWRKKRNFRTATYDEQPNLDPAPFADLFGDSDDLFETDLVPDFLNNGNGKEDNDRKKASGPGKGGLYKGGVEVFEPSFQKRR